MSADPGLDGRSSKITGAVVTGRCSLCNEPIMAAKVPGEPAVTLAHVEECDRADATGFVSSDGLWYEGTPPAWATTVARPHGCFTPPSTSSASPSPPTPPRKAPAKKAPAKTRKKDSP